jgi:hypothetical protein
MHNFNSSSHCRDVEQLQKHVCAHCPSTPPSSEVTQLLQLDSSKRHNTTTRNPKDTMLITETHKDVPTQAGGNMSALRSCYALSANEAYTQNRGFHLPSYNRELPQGQISWRRCLL